MNSQQLHSAQQKFFGTHQTRDVAFRIEQLKKLKSILKENEDQLFQAIKKDFGKSGFETYVSELALLYHEINTFIRKVKKWSRRKKVSTGLANFPAKSYVIPEPLGTSLVISAWNYPYQLSLVPAATAIAAGNTVILKPSEVPATTSNVLARLINDNFSQEFFAVVEGGVPETTELLELPFDKIFFTGSSTVGKIVYAAAARNLTPVTLELGGKSPTFVLPDCDLKMAAKRIVWSKFLNAGQTCIAPDYILVHQSIEQEVIDALTAELKSCGSQPDDIGKKYVQIINDKHFQRLTNLIDRDRVCYGGDVDSEARFISPTLMRNCSFEDQVMQEEIFGPILPLLTFTDLDQAIGTVNELPKPLACYVYGRDRAQIDKVLNEVSFGGGAVNESVMHISNSRLPFGGVGASGIGSYHGQAGFEAFSHFKSILDKPSWFEAPLKYPPYSEWKRRLIAWLIE